MKTILVDANQKLYTGIIVEESLRDKSILNTIETMSAKVSEDGDWHMLTVRVPEEFFSILSHAINHGTWYAHFWNDHDVVVVFQNKIIPFHFDKKDTWSEVLEHGRLLGIPEDQLDFPIYN